MRETREGSKEKGKEDFLSLLPRFPRVSRSRPIPFLSPPKQAIPDLAAPGVAGSAQFLRVCLGLLLLFTLTSFFHD